MAAHVACGRGRDHVGRSVAHGSRQGFRRFFRSSDDVDGDIREELEAHLQMKAEDLIASGLSRERAEAEARRLLGNRTWLVEECRKVRVHIRRSESRKERFDTLRQDVRYAVRRMQKTPAVTALVIAVLGLGIGVNTTVFSAVNDWFFRAPPGVSEPDRLVVLFRSLGPDGRRCLGHLGYLRYAEQVESFTGLVASRGVRMVLQEDDGTALPQTQVVSANYFDVLGVDMTLGRGFLPEEEQEAGTHPVAMVSHTFWRDRMGGPGGLSSETIRLNGTVFTVVGVAGERFRGLEVLDDVDVWVPLAMAAAARPRFPIWKSDQKGGISHGARATRAWSHARRGSGGAGRPGHPNRGTGPTDGEEGLRRDRPEREDAEPQQRDRRCPDPAVRRRRRTDFTARVRQHRRTPAGTGDGTVS